MASSVDPVPEGFHTVTPYLMARDVDGLIEFVKAAFGAKEIFRATGAHGGVHVEVSIEDSMVMVGGGENTETMPAATFLYVSDADAAYERALRAGAASIEEPADRPEGNRRAGVREPHGNLWLIATHTEGVSREELRERHENSTEPR